MQRALMQCHIRKEWPLIRKASFRGREDLFRSGRNCLVRRIISRGRAARKRLSKAPAARRKRLARSGKKEHWRRGTFLPRADKIRRKHATCVRKSRERAGFSLTKHIRTDTILKVAWKSAVVLCALAGRYAPISSANEGGGDHADTRCRRHTASGRVFFV